MALWGGGGGCVPGTGEAAAPSSGAAVDLGGGLGRTTVGREIWGWLRSPLRMGTSASRRKGLGGVTVWGGGSREAWQGPWTEDESEGQTGDGYRDGWAPWEEGIWGSWASAWKLGAGCPLGSLGAGQEPGCSSGAPSSPGFPDGVWHQDSSGVLYRTCILLSGSDTLQLRKGPRSPHGWGGCGRPVSRGLGLPTDGEVVDARCLGRLLSHQAPSALGNQAKHESIPIPICQEAPQGPLLPTSRTWMRLPGPGYTALTRSPGPMTDAPASQSGIGGPGPHPSTCAG